MVTVSAARGSPRDRQVGSLRTTVKSRVVQDYLRVDPRLCAEPAAALAVALVDRRDSIFVENQIDLDHLVLCAAPHWALPAGAPLAQYRVRRGLELLRALLEGERAA